MLSIHNIKRIRARADERALDTQSNWVELHVEGGYSETEHLIINLYFSEPELAREFYEAYHDKITASEIALKRLAEADA